MSNEKTKVITSPARLAFSKNIWEPNKKGRYTLAVVFDQNEENKETLDALKAIAAEEASKKWGDKIPSGLKNGMKVENREEMLSKYEFMRDRVTVNLSTSHTFPVGRKDAENNWHDITEKELKSGDYVRLVVTAYAYDTDGNKGIGFNISALVKEADGEPFYTRQTGAEMFGMKKAPSEGASAFDNFGF